MLTVAEDMLTRLAREHDKEVSVHLYGQEVNPETYAISKADLILKGEGDEANNVQYGSTLSVDAFPAREFDFMLSNPPLRQELEERSRAHGRQVRNCGPALRRRARRRP